MVAVTKEIEKSITPDKVVDMYDKTLKEAESKILQSFVFDSNYLNGVVVEVQPDYLNARKSALLRFELNGRKHEDKIDIGKETTLTRTLAYELLFNGIRDSITREMLKTFPYKEVASR